MKILFLDIDGVLNSDQSERMFSRTIAENPDLFGEFSIRKFCPISCSNLLTIIESFDDLRIVVSSSWRVGETLESLKEILACAGIPKGRIIGMTPVLRGIGKQRGDEIKHWLDNADMDIGEYVVLDDSRDMRAVWSHFVNTNWFIGLDYFKAQEAIRVLRGQLQEGSPPVT